MISGLTDLLLEIVESLVVWAFCGVAGLIILAVIWEAIR
jgi:hypothetical protein